MKTKSCSATYFISRALVVVSLVALAACARSNSDDAYDVSTPTVDYVAFRNAGVDIEVKFKQQDVMINGTRSGVTVTYESDNNTGNTYITLNGTMSAVTAVLSNALRNLTFAANDQYKITVDYVSGTYTSSTNPNFLIDLQTDGAYFSDRATSPKSYILKSAPQRVNTAVQTKVLYHYQRCNVPVSDFNSRPPSTQYFSRSAVISTGSAG